MTWDGVVESDISMRLCLTLMHSLWQFALLAALAWVFGRRSSTQRAYALCVAAMMIGLLLAPATYLWLGGAAAVNRVPPHGANQQATEPTVRHVDVSPVAHATAIIGIVTTGEEPAAPHHTARETSRAAASWQSLARIAALLYAVGVLVMLLRLAAGTWCAHRLVARAEPVIDAGTLQRLKALTARLSMRMTPLLLQTERIAVPKVVGLLRPAILLPASALSGLSPDDLEMVLTHELMHLRRHDMWVNLLQRLAEAAFFFNPAVWYLSRRISLLREFSCDEITCQVSSGVQSDARMRYATALIRIAELSYARSRSLGRADRGQLASLAAAGRSPSELRRRVSRLLGEPVRDSLTLSRGHLVGIVAFLALLAGGPAAWDAVSSAEGRRAPAELEKQAPAANDDPGGDERPAPDAADAEPTEINVIVAEHVLLLEGKEITTWEELKEHVAALPAPSRTVLTLHFTRGAREAGREEPAIDRLMAMQNSLPLKTYRWAAEFPWGSARYDRVRTPKDLQPDESLRVEGKVIDEQGRPVAGAQVLLVMPTDAPHPHASYDVGLIEGRVSEDLQHALTLTRSDSSGQFVVHPEGDDYRLVALHPRFGFAVVDAESFQPGRTVHLDEWAALVMEAGGDATPYRVSVSTGVSRSGGKPGVTLVQGRSSGAGDDARNELRFLRVPPGHQTTVERTFWGDENATYVIPETSLNLAPGERQRVAFGPLTKKQRELIEDMRSIREELAKGDVAEASAQARQDPQTSETPADQDEAAISDAPAPDATDAEQIEMNVIVAEHVLLLEGKEIITWEELVDRIAALPDPSRAYPQFYITRGAQKAGRYEPAKEWIWQIHRDFKLKGHGEGSLSARADLRYDRIRTAADLQPDELLRVDGIVVDRKGDPVSGAQVVLVTPADPALSYKGYSATLVDGQLRNPLEHVLTTSDAVGRFAVHPEDEEYWLFALHPDIGFTATTSEMFSLSHTLTLMEWSGLVMEVDQEARDYEIALATVVPESGRKPQMTFHQYWDGEPGDALKQFRFPRVPPFYRTTVLRRFFGEEGTSYATPDVSVELLPEETRRIGLGPVTEQQRERLEKIRRTLQRARAEEPDKQ